MYRVKVKIHKRGYKAIYLYGVYCSSPKPRKSVKDKKEYIIKKLQEDLLKTTGEDCSCLLFEVIELKKLKTDFVLRDV